MDELTQRLTALREPVGQDQPRLEVVGMGEDALPQAPLGVDLQLDGSLRGERVDQSLPRPPSAAP
ncbi:MAG: hypothetical protein QM765_33945 [Myxococcales bacterium]